MSKKIIVENTNDMKFKINLLNTAVISEDDADLLLDGKSRIYSLHTLEEWDVWWDKLLVLLGFSE